jgi:hypothetical protein
MSQITLISPDNNSIQGLVESALSDKARLLQIAIRQTEKKLAAFEESYKLSTQDFVAKFTQNQLQHSDDFDDWYGESCMLTRLQSKLTRIQGIQIAD